MWVQAAGRLVGGRGPPSGLCAALAAPGVGRGGVHSLAGQGVPEGASDLPLLLILKELFHVPGDVLEDGDEGADVDVVCLGDEEVPELGDRSLIRGVVSP